MHRRSNNKESAKSKKPSTVLRRSQTENEHNARPREAQEARASKIKKNLDSKPDNIIDMTKNRPLRGNDRRVPVRCNLRKPPLVSNTNHQVNNWQEVERATPFSSCLPLPSQEESVSTAQASVDKVLCMTPQPPSYPPPKVN